MDDDDLRRGQPTVHKKFNEAIAVLAGDALHAYAFELLASSGNARVVGEVAKAIGNYGMLGGQICDILAEDREVTIQEVEHIHSHKTGALIRVSLMVGAILGGLSEDKLAMISNYGAKVGLAFQIVDDILDVIGDAEAMGKGVNKDDDQGKATYPGVIGLEDSRKIASDLIESAKTDITKLGQSAEVFGVLADLIISRQN
jgi:geranylgeranyl diphosphate synthase, type II